MVVHTFNVSTWEAEVVESLVLDQPGLHCKSLSHKTKKERNVGLEAQEVGTSVEEHQPITYKTLTPRTLGPKPQTYIWMEE